MTTSKKSKGCIFCAIIDEDIPCAKVYENNMIYAFLDIDPASMGHTLVVPKYHAETLLDLPDEICGPVTIALKKIGAAVMEERKADGFNCLQNNFEAAGQMVFHAHWHIIPRFNSDKLFDFPKAKYASEEEIKDLAQKLYRRLG